MQTNLNIWYSKWTRRMAYFPHSFLMPFWFFLFSGETGDCWPESMPDDMGDTSDSVDSSVFSDFAKKTEGTHSNPDGFFLSGNSKSLLHDVFPVLRRHIKGSQNNSWDKFASEQERHQTVNCSGYFHCLISSFWCLPTGCEKLQLPAWCWGMHEKMERNTRCYSSGVI